MSYFVEVLLTSAADARDRGDLRSARRRYQDVLKADPSNEEARRGLALLDGAPPTAFDVTAATRIAEDPTDFFDAGERTTFADPPAPAGPAAYPTPDARLGAFMPDGGAPFADAAEEPTVDGRMNPAPRPAVISDFPDPDRPTLRPPAARAITPDWPAFVTGGGTSASDSAAASASSRFGATVPRDVADRDYGPADDGLPLDTEENPQAMALRVFGPAMPPRAHLEGAGVVRSRVRATTLLLASLLVVLSGVAGVVVLAPGLVTPP